MGFHEEAFEAAAKITAAVAEEAEVELNEKGAQQAGDFFAALYRRLRAIANDEDEKPGKPGSFEVYQDGTGEYRFRLKACNGEVIAVSEGYTTKDSCLKGVASVKRSAPEAAVKQQ